MKHHDGRKRINKVDGGKARAKKQYHKKLRAAGEVQLTEGLKNLQTEYNEIRAMVVQILGERKADFWMKTDNLNLGGCSPTILIIRGRGHKVREFVESALNDKLVSEGKRSGAV